MDFGCELPKDVWGSMILPRLSLKEYIRFSAVCRSWRSIAVEMELHRLPWLMLSQDMDSHTALFYSLQEGTTYTLNFTDSASNSFCTGSTQGYLIFSDGEANFVFNPFSQSTTPLPPQYVALRHKKESLTYHRHYYRKSVISAPDPSQLFAASICSYNLVSVTCSSNNKEWSVFGIKRVPFLLTTPDTPITPLLIKRTPQEDDNDNNDEEEEEEKKDDDEEEEDDINDEEDDQWSLVDIIFYKGVLYGLSESFTLVRFNNLEDAKTKPQQVMNMVTTRMPQRGYSMSTGYLVESSYGDLLMVFRIRNGGSVKSKFIYVTKGFLVFKLDDKLGDEIRWVEMKNLGDEMIFLGKNASISVSTKGIPGLKGNCIYFSDDAFPNWSFPYYAWPATNTLVFYTDNGVFHLEDGRIDSFLPHALSGALKAPPIWVMPNKPVVAID